MTLAQKQKRIAVFMFMNADVPQELQEKYMLRYTALRMQIRANKGLQCSN